MTVEQINVTLGTAGHIDHGKTALVKLLTGCDTDRLKEEKERGMSIDLGFAPCKIADLEVGIVDVPGHENFIKTMVAGATGMDAVMLVVAADDGVMPQTREHLDILTLLGMERGFIALTKIDRVDNEHRELVLELTRDFLRGTFLENAPICPVSSITGEGFDGFYATLCQLLESIQPRRLDGVFRLPVDRAFSARGFGTIIAGIPMFGSARVDDEVVLLPQGLQGKIRQIEVYGRASELVKAGQCAAINLRHWDASQVHRGDVLTLPGYFESHEWFVARLRLLPEARLVLKSGTRLKLHTGTAEIPVTIYLLEHDPMTAGDEALVQFRAPAGLVAGPGDPFIVRVPSPARTIGGGMLVEGGARRLKRTRPDTIQVARQCADACPSPTSSSSSRSPFAMPLQVRSAKQNCRSERRFNRNPCAESSPPWLNKALSSSCSHACTFTATRSRTCATVSPNAWPTSTSSFLRFRGFSIDELREAVRLDRTVGSAVVANMQAEGRLVENQGRLAHPEHSAEFQGADADHSRTMDALFREHLFRPPGLEELRQKTGADEPTLKRIMNALRQQQKLVRIEGGLLFHRDAIEKAREILVDYLQRGRTVGKRQVQVPPRYDPKIRIASARSLRSRGRHTTSRQYTTPQGTAAHGRFVIPGSAES